MARRRRSAQLETRTARLKLRVRKKPHDFTTIAPGIALAYRRNQGAGTWVVRVADGHGGNWTKGFAIADDHEDADGNHVLDFWQAQDKARALARGSSDDGRPCTVTEALDAYAADLRARGGQVSNAFRVRRHLPPTLAAKAVALLTSRELQRLRDGLAHKIKPRERQPADEGAQGGIRLGEPTRSAHHQFRSLEGRTRGPAGRTPGAQRHPRRRAGARPGRRSPCRGPGARLAGRSGRGLRQ